MPNITYTPRAELEIYLPLIGVLNYDLLRSEGDTIRTTSYMHTIYVMNNGKKQEMHDRKCDIELLKERRQDKHDYERGQKMRVFVLYYVFPVNFPHPPPRYFNTGALKNIE